MESALASRLAVSVGRLASFAALLALLVACGRDASPTAPPRIATMPDPAYVLTLSLEPGDTPETTAARSGGAVLVWNEGASALLGFDAEVTPAELAGRLGVAPEAVRLERNEPAFASEGRTVRLNGSSQVWARGSSQVWARGSSQVWARGSSQVWARGEFAWLPENTTSWQRIGLEAGHARGDRLGLGVTVAIIDSGVDPDHPALREALAPTERWWDFVDNDAWPAEEGDEADAAWGHGTAVAGIVRQIAPRATLLPLRVLTPGGSGDVAAVAAAIDWAVAQGADVINLSLGAEEPSAAVQEAIRSAGLRGVYVVASSGNSGDARVNFPASVATEGSVGARLLSVTSVDGDDVKSDFATFGAAVELAAPGEAIHAPAPGERRAAWSGTSMAAPVASGALALAVGERPGAARSLQTQLKGLSFDLYGDPRNAAWTGGLGEGRIDVDAFVTWAVGDHEDGDDGDDDDDDDGDDDD